MGISRTICSIIKVNDGSLFCIFCVLSFELNFHLTRVSLQMETLTLTPNRLGGGGGIHPQAGSSVCCAETVSSRKLKLCDFYYIPISLNSEYKPVPSDIHCRHGNAIVEQCSVKFWLESVENCNFLLKSFPNFNLGLLFVISISKLPPIPNFKQIG